MKKSVRLFITGNIQPVFFNRFIKNHADRLGIKGFMRQLEDKRIEIFIEGDTESMSKIIPICKRGPQHSVIRKVEEKEEKFQDFKEFRVLGF